MNLVLLYNFLIVSAFSFIIPPLSIHVYDLKIVYAPLICAFPIAGYIADICCRRYKIVKISMWWVWASSVILCGISTIEACTARKSPACEAVATVFLVVTGFGLVGFLSNIVQFGMDQLQDAPTGEISAFVVWYVWTLVFGVWFQKFIYRCPCGSHSLKSLPMVFIPASLSLALCLDSCCNHWLLKEPANKNPFKLFFGVLRYAAKNKSPRQRSAFTYWEDKPYSRIDLAKDKYGGPYTTEQVEDVKVVLRILLLLCVVCWGIGLSFTISFGSNNHVYSHLSGADKSSFFHEDCSLKYFWPCAEQFSVQHFWVFALLFFIPLHEFVIYPIFWKCIAIHMTSFVKLVLGFLFVFLSYVAYLVIEAVAYQRMDPSHNNTTCFLSSEKFHLPLDYRWLCVAEVLHGVAFFYIFCGIIEFICSQTPHTLKGLLNGSFYLLLFLAMVFSSLVLLPVPLTVDKWPPLPYGCGVWVYLSVALFFLLFTLLLVVVYKKVYRMRRRDEDIHNRHIFAINYYSHYVQYNKEMGGN